MVHLLVETPLLAVERRGVLDSQPGDVGEAQPKNADVIIVVDADFGHSDVVPRVVERRRYRWCHHREWPRRDLQAVHPRTEA